MKSISLGILSVFALGLLGASGDVKVNIEKFGKSLGGWDEKKGKAAGYEMANNKYRTFRPDISPTPDGGLFISVRIDHERGLLASDDHASLEITVDGEGNLQSSRTSVSLQGKRVASDLISGGVRGAGQTVTGQSPAEVVISVGADLVASLTEKMSRETKVESGRVGFPAVVRHNLNLLYQAIEVIEEEPEVDEAALAEEGTTSESEHEEEPSETSQASVNDPSPDA